MLDLKVTVNLNRILADRSQKLSRPRAISLTLSFLRFGFVHVFVLAPRLVFLALII